MCKALASLSSQRERVLSSDLSGARFLAAMKLLVVLLALTAVPGGQAVAIREAPTSEPKLRPLIDKISMFGRDAYIAVVETFEKILFSAPITIVNAHLLKAYETLREQERELLPEIREAKEILDAVMTKFSRVHHEWNLNQYEYNLEGVKEALAQYVDPVASKALKYVEWLEENIRPVVIETYRQAFERPRDQVLESLNSQVSSYTKEPQAKELEEIEESIQASLVEAGKQLRLGMETLHKQLKPYLIPFLNEYKKYKPALTEWMEAPFFPPRKKD
ncbi:uncharacterized protein LOC100554919 [Anolis carolinensis]|uniref:uncharacterized protein LOC100554919 n=1 Tax=Anolis carolinensis TaxID=28377 RepID=UPI000203B01E|nr:PREDICTED: uncharacterized protein LOC100554919 [Anolis carolinensis]|eukprot:XP_003230050.1 PREDICTED: uncharacterized protein LOC100554919 [Anolis carolinensis]